MIRTIEEVLEEMIGANYMMTQKQINEIRHIHAAEIACTSKRIMAAYDAGRKHDREKLDEILAGGQADD